MGLAKKAIVNLVKDLPEALAKETRAIFEDTWMGDHPGVLRVLTAAGRLLGEAKHIEGDGTGKPAKPGLASIFNK
jgi:hypothetical protein